MLKHKHVSQRPNNDTGTGLEEALSIRFQRGPSVYLSKGGLMICHRIGNSIAREVLEMAVVTQNDRRVIDLGGPDGNAYVLMGIAYGLLRKTGTDPDLHIQIMKADDYGHLVRYFYEMFGEHFTVVLPEGINSLEDL